jgi:3',5'-cyclic AMP phosphodiesterase CpdA
MTKIALISDIHFGKHSRTKDFTVPGEVLISEELGAKSLKEELIKKLIEEKIEYLIVAGDITSIGSPNEFIHCEKTLIEIATKSSIANSNVIMCLGNHDIDWNINGISGDYKNETMSLVENVKKSYLTVAGAVANHWLENAFGFGDGNEGPAPYSGVKEFDNIIFFTLNSGWLCSKEDSIKQGKLDAKQLDWLESVLNKHKDSKKWKILVLHHHPFNYPYPLPFSDHSLLAEGPELTNIIGKYGVNIVCHGHRHHPRVKNQLESDWKNAITFISAGSLSVNIQHRGEYIPNLFHVIELLDEKSFYLRSYQYTPIEGWKENSKRDGYTPIDFEMFFQKPYNQDEKILGIEEICALNEGSDQKKLLKWKELPPALKTITLDELNSSIKYYCDRNNLSIFGKYPEENIAIIKK